MVGPDVDFIGALLFLIFAEESVFVGEGNSKKILLKDVILKIFIWF